MSKAVEIVRENFNEEINKGTLSAMATIAVLGINEIVLTNVIRATLTVVLTDLLNRGRIIIKKVDKAPVE